MADIKTYPIWAHLRSDPNTYVLRYRNGRRVAAGKGLAFWFLPINTGLSEVPVDDRDLQFIFQGRSADFQAVTIQGELSYRVTDPGVLAERIDFSIDIRKGVHRKQPLEQLAALFTGTLQKHAIKYVARTNVQVLVNEGPDAIQRVILDGFAGETVFADMGLEMVSLRITDIKPVAELEKALQTPTRERIQQDADEATFQRRALAVEKERAIAENELQNRIELAAREEQLISKQGQNERRRVEEDNAAQEMAVRSRIERDQMEVESQAKNRRELSAAEAEAIRVEGLAEAERVEAVGLAEAAGEKERMSVYASLPANVVLALAIQEMAGKLKSIDHLNITPDVLQSNLAGLFAAGAKKLQGAAGDGA